MNHCGTCSLCCKVMSVSALDKPAMHWCTHCDKSSGCRIYDTRPQACEVFDCVWLQTQVTDTALPVQLRPDHCGVVLASFKGSKGTPAIQAYCDRPGIWRTGAIGGLLKDMAAGGVRVFIYERGKLVRVLTREGEIREPETT